jgi:DNA-binding NtrC family response regulator
MLKKQLDDKQGGAIVSKEDKKIAVNNATPTITTPQIYIQQPPKPVAEDAIAEEYIEPEREPESLNLSDVERQMLEKALERNGGNRKKAALELGISDRTLYRRIKQYGLE